jgi:hypothetical protein
MTNWADEFPFLKDAELEPEFKKVLLEKSFEEKARRALLSEQGSEKRAADRLEWLKFWNNTPLVVALVPGIRDE